MAQYDFMDYGVGYDPDEEERKRREAIAARMDAEAYANPVAPIQPVPATPSFGEAAQQYFNNQVQGVQNKFNQVGQMLSNPGMALEQQLENEKRRMMSQQPQMTQAQPQPTQTLPEDTEVKKQTIKTYGDGSQEQTTTTQIPAPQAQQVMQPAPVAPAPQAVQQPVAQPKPVAPGPLETRTPVPQNLQAQGAINPNQPMPNIGQVPTPGPATQVAGPTQVATPSMTGGAPVGQVAAAPGASLAQMGQAAQAQQPAWVNKANEAGNDFYKLLQVAQEHPESRDFIQDKVKQSFKQQTLKDELAAITKAAGEGDLKAQNKLLQLIKPETGKPKEEATIGDYAKAYMFAKMGLPHLAKQYEDKIGGVDTKFGQVTVNGTNWAVEKNQAGDIIRAKDDEGNIATEATLNKLRASSAPFGSHAFGFTGEANVIPPGQPNAGEEYRTRTNSITGQVENIISTGPNAGKVYTGPAGSAKSVGTQYSKALNQAFIDFQTKPTVAMAQKMMEIAGQVDDGSGRTINQVASRIRQMTPEIFTQISSGQAGTPPAPVGTGGTTGVTTTPATSAGTTGATGGTIPASTVRQPSITGGAPVGGAGGGSLTQKLEGQKANIQTAAEVERARLKPPAEQAGKNEAKDVAKQGFADSTYPLLQAVREEIRKSTGSKIGASVDELATIIGASTNGAQAIAKLDVLSGPIKMNIPRFEGAQSDRDVQEYARQAGNFADPTKPIKTRLAALDAMETLLSKYDKAGNNDWTFGRKQPKAGSTSSGNTFKKVQ